MNSQSPIYSLKFTISWIIVYSSIVFLLFQIINFFISLYLGLWVLNLIIELTERLFLRFGKRIVTVEKWSFYKFNLYCYIFLYGRLAQFGRALARHARGHKFKSCISHKFFFKITINLWKIILFFFFL